MKHYITIFAAISAIASFGAVNVQTAKLSTLPGKTMVVTNITGAAAVSDIPTDSTVAGWGYIKSWTETDPTVPSWAKATSKPTYGWEEIINTPTALPNPNALSFYSKSGTLISSYDGSEAMSVIMEDADFQAWRNSKNLYLGENSHSTGEDYSVALGVGTEASGTHSVALGAGGVRATAMNALAVGNSVEARAIASTAIGYSSFATAQSATAIGGNAYANGERSHAAGWAAIADALNSTAVGNAARVHTGSVGATAIGSGATVGPNATNAVQIGFGVNNDPETLQFMSRKVAFSSDIAATNTVFSNEVLAVSLELFDTNTVAVLNDLAGTVDGIPLEGGAASIGTILLALLAAVAWLKKNKIGANDVKRVYNVNGTQYIDGDGGVYKADVELGGHWTLKQLHYTYIAKYKGRREVAGNPFYWVTDDGYRYIYYTPESGKISINGNLATPDGQANLNPEHGDDFPGTFSYSNWTAVFTKQQSVFPSEPQDKIAKKSELDGKANSSDIPSLSGQTFDISVDAQFKNMCISVARELGAVVTHTTDDTSTGGQVAQAYGITPTDATTFGELQNKAGLNDSDTLGDL